MAVSFIIDGQHGRVLPSGSPSILFVLIFEMLLCDAIFTNKIFIRSTTNIHVASAYFNGPTSFSCCCVFSSSSSGTGWFNLLTIQIQLGSRDRDAYQQSYKVVCVRSDDDANQTVTGHLTEGSFVRNGVLQIPKFDAKPNPNPNPNSNPNPSLTLTLCLYVSDK